MSFSDIYYLASLFMSIIQIRLQIDNLTLQKLIFSNNLTDLFMYKEPWDRSPRRQAINQQLDEHTSKIKELLKGDIRMLEQQNHILKKKVYQTEQLQRRVQNLINDNAILVKDNIDLTSSLSRREDQLKRWREQTEHLKNQLIFMESNMKKQLEAQRARLELKAAEQNQRLQLENFKLNEGIKAHGRQLDQSHTRSAKQRLQYNQAISSLIKESDGLRNSLTQFKKMHEQEMRQLKAKMKGYYQAEIDNLHRQMQVIKKSLQEQIYELQKELKNKIKSTEDLQKDKKILIQKIEQESKYRVQLANLRKKHQQVTDEMQVQVQKLKNQAKDKQNQIEYLETLNQKIDQDSEKEIKSVKSLLAQQKQKRQLDLKAFQNKELQLLTLLKQKQNKAEEQKSTLAKNFKEIERQLRQQSQIRCQEHAKYKDDVRKQFNAKQKQFQSMKDGHEDAIRELKGQIRSLQHNLQIVQKENDSLKECIGQRDRRIREIQQKVRLHTKKEAELYQQLDKLRQLLSKHDKYNLNVIKENRVALQNQFRQELQNLRLNYETKLKTEERNSKSLRQQLKNKEIQLEQLLAMYGKMKKEVGALTQQEANMKNIDLKFAGSSADLIASKNLFDVFIKNKVKSVCLPENEQK